jgi:ABC-type transport system substrate-binding protein
VFNDAIAKLRSTSDPTLMLPLFDQLIATLRRGGYCANAEVDKLASEAGSTESPAARKVLYLRIASMLTDRGGQNRMRYCNPQVDRWIVGAERANDRPAKLDLFAKIQRTVSDELPQIYLWYPANVLAARTRVDNIQIEASGSWFFISKLTLEGR